MKITDIQVHQLQPGSLVRYGLGMNPVPLRNILVRVITDEGVEGHCVTWLMRVKDIEAVLEGYRRRLIGRDPHDVEAISYELSHKLERPTGPGSAIDICLWDALGKFHGVPVYKLLGAARERIRAYASTITYETVEEYVQLAFECRQAGFTAFKLHGFNDARQDIELCRTVREAVGDDMDLMLDPVMDYDRREAIMVGRALEKLGFYWYEAPISDNDMLGLADLSRALDIPVAGAEGARDGLRAYPRFLTGNVVDSIRGVGDKIGGISALRKAFALCEAFNVRFEPHSYGTTLVQAAHLNVALASFNCDFIEIPVPLGTFDQCMADVITVTEDGYVEAPTKPGLGYELDWTAVERETVRVL